MLHVTGVYAIRTQETQAAQATTNLHHSFPTSADNRVPNLLNFFIHFPLLMSFLCSLSQLARCVTSRGVRSSAAFHTHLTALRVDAAAASSYIPTYPELKQLKKVLFFPLRFICSDLQVPTTSFKWEVGTACCLLTSIATLYPFHS